MASLQGPALRHSRHAAHLIARSTNCTSLSSLCPKPRMLSHPRLQPPLPAQTHQRRPFLVQLKRQAQSLKEATTSTSSSPEPPSVRRSNPTSNKAPTTTTEQPSFQLTNLPYFIRRTASNQLPVYLVTKAGGTKQQTKIQKAEGDLDSLKTDLTLYLDTFYPGAKRSAEVSVHPLNGHVIVRGWRKSEIQKFLQERSF